MSMCPLYDASISPVQPCGWGQDDIGVLVIAGAHVATIAKNELTVLVESVMITIDFAGRKFMSKPIFGNQK